MRTQLISHTLRAALFKKLKPADFRSDADNRTAQCQDAQTVVGADKNSLAAVFGKHSVLNSRQFFFPAAIHRLYHCCRSAPAFAKFVEDIVSVIADRRPGI